MPFIEVAANNPTGKHNIKRARILSIMQYTSTVQSASRFEKLPLFYERKTERQTIPTYRWYLPQI